MGGLGLIGRRRAIQASPTAASFNDSLIGAYTFVGRSNSDADRDILYDASGKGNNMKAYSLGWGSGDGYTKNGYYDDFFCIKGSGYASVVFPESLTDYTIIVSRSVYGGLNSKVAVIGSGATEDSSASPVVLEGVNNGAYENISYGRMVKGRPSTLITWMTNEYVNNVAIEGEAIVQPWNTAYIGRYGAAKYSSDARVKVKAIYIFKKCLAPEQVEKFIQDNIDESYVLP